MPYRTGGSLCFIYRRYESEIEKNTSRVRHTDGRADDTFKHRKNDGPRRSNMKERAKKLPTKTAHYERDTKYFQ